ncbi:extracellular solute-binding protein [Orbus hercynius]
MANQHELAGPQQPTDSTIQTYTLPDEKIVTTTAFALIGEPKYRADFTHFDYAYPNAPKGGELKLAEIGTYDNFNRYASRGAPERSADDMYETLFMQSEDELNSFYPLLATSITYSDAGKWAEVTINPTAYFSDGIPLTAEDVEFSFTKFMTEGVSQYRVYNEGVTVKALDKYRVRFELPTANRERLLTLVGNFTVLPKHFWQNKNFAEPLTTPPIGSGPYVLSDYQLGQYAIYRRDPNYWAKNLSVNQGRYNFDTKRIDYYLDDSIALEAFKAGEYDFRLEGQPKNWFTQYQGHYFDDGFIVRQEDEVTTAVNTRWLAFNLERDVFRDTKVRQALTLAFDFAWLNRAFYYNSYQQPTSFFENTPYAAKGLPNDLEREWLTPYATIIPPSVFGSSYQVPPSDGDGFNRSHLLQAKALLEQAGWVMKDNQLVNQQTGKPFEFELLLYMGSDIKYAIAYQQNLAKLGIKMVITTVDYAQINSRLRERDYDMMPTSYPAIPYPTSQLIILWGSEYLNSTWNSSGLHNQAIDDLIMQIPNYSHDEQKLTALARALDRILTQEYPMIPMWYPRYIYYAYWHKFDKPAVKPRYSIGLDTWWYDANQAAQLPKNNR